MFGGDGSAFVDLHAASGTVGFDPAGGFTVPAEFLFHGEYKRAGNDLKIIGEHGKAFVVHDYFKTDQLHTLFAPDGAALSGDIVAALTGPLAPGEYAQATPPQNAGEAIGRVATLSGRVVAVRNGVAVALNVGDVVLKGDVVQTQGGSAIGVIFADGSTFDLGANARMVLNEFVYNPAATSGNSSLINLVQGSIVFVAGQVAHTGDMKVGTPSATMGIRGTAVQVDIDVSNGTTQLSVLIEPGGRVGSFNIYSLSGQLLGTANDANGKWTVTPTAQLDAVATIAAKTPAEMAQAFTYVQTAFQTQSIGQVILQQNPLPPSQQNQQNQQNQTPDQNQQNNPQNQNPTQNTPKSQIGSSDVSTTHIAITNTQSADGSANPMPTVTVTPPAAGSPETVPFVPPTSPNVNTPPPPPPVNTQVFFETNSANTSVHVSNAMAPVNQAGALLFTGGDTHSVSVTPHAGNVGSLSATISQDTTSSTEGDIAYTYTAPQGQNPTQPDVFDVTVTDNLSGSAATTSISFVLQNHNPVAVDATYTVTETQIASASSNSQFVLPNVLANVSDPDGDIVTVSAIGAPTVSKTGAGLVVLSVKPETAAAGEVARYDIQTNYGDAHVAVGSDGQIYLWSTTGDDPFKGLGANETATINFNYTVVDGFGGSATAGVSITINGADDAPTLGNAGNTIGYTELQVVPPAIDAVLTVADVDNANLVGATVSIASGLLTGDSLNFINQNGITGSYNAATGVLSLSGTATVGQYQAALESVTFSSSSANPTNFDTDTGRSISWVVNDGTLNSAAQTTTVNITAVDNAPVIANVSGTVSTNQNTSVLLAAPTATVTDVDAGPSDLLLATLSVTHGTLIPFGSVPGLTIVNGQDGSDGTLSFTGTQAAITQAIDTGVTFAPSLNYNGPDTLTFTVNDQGHTGSGGPQTATATVGITVSAAPGAPVITTTAPAQDNASSINIVGTAENGSTVTLYNGVTVVGTTTADATTGAWHVNGIALSNGSDYSFTATATDAANNTSVASNALVFHDDQSAPGAPVITTTAPAQDNASSINIVGTAENGSTVTLYNGVTVVGTTTADATTGAWHVNGIALSNGSDYSFTATATDAANNTSVASNALVFHDDQSAPGAPVITTTAPAQDNASSINIVGTAENGSTVTLYNGVTVVGTTTADATTGAWHVNGIALSNGSDYSFTATATDAANNTSVASNALVFHDDQSAPGAPVITTTAPAQDNASSINIVGTAENGSTVTLYNGVTVVGTTTADATTGAWHVNGIALSNGSDYSFTATATDAANNTSVASNALVFHDDQSAPGAPVITTTAPAQDNASSINIVGTAENGSTVTLYNGVTVVGTTTADATTGAWHVNGIALSNGSDYSFTATATDAANNTSVASNALVFHDDQSAPGAPVITTTAPAQDNASSINIVGTAENGSTVTLYNGVTVVGTTTADATTGAWHVNGIALSNGSDYSFTATATDAANNTSVASNALVFHDDQSAPGAPVITTTAPAQDNASSINIVGTAENGSTVTLYNGVTVVGTTTADATTGAWHVNGIALSNGSDYSFTATATDAANNTSVASNALVFHDDQSAPGAPVITTTAPAQDNASSINIVGTAENGSTVTLYNGVTVVGTTTADATTGAWHVNGIALSNGSDYSFTATATDAANNTSVASNALVFHDDQSAPGAPVITTTAPAQDNASSINIVGTAENGSTVTLYNGVTVVGTTTADATTGAWHVNGIALSNGSDYSFTATATDAANNTSVASNALVFHDDQSAPGAPVITTTAPAQDNASSINIVGTAENGSTVTLYNGVTVVGTTTADATTGAWHVNGIALSNGSDYSFTATATDAANNTSVASNALVFHDDQSAPVITTTAPAQDNASSINIVGTAENGSTVTLYNGVTVVGTTTADATTGAWHVNGIALSNGSDYSFTATATDAANNTSVASNALVFHDDQSAPGTVDWINNNGGDWNNLANASIDWSGGLIPNSQNDVAIDAQPGSYTVKASNDTVNSLTTVAGATLEITTGTFGISQGTGAGANSGTLAIDDSAALKIEGSTINNTGEISENSVGSNTDLYIDSTNAMLTGGGAVSLSDNSHNFITASSVGATLTNVDNTISGSGQIIGDTVHGYVTLALVNEQQGVIDATGSSDLVLNVNSFTNNGLVEATNPNALAQPGGLAIKNTTVDQSGGGTIEASGSRVDLQSAIILGGTLATANGGVIDTIDFGSMLTGTSSQVNNTGTLVVNDDTALTLQGTINNTGEISENSVGSNTDLYIDSTNAILTGGGAVSLSDNSHNFITASSVGATLTNVDNTISGSGQIIGDTVHGYVTLALVNEQQGVIDATGSSDLVLNVNSSTNNGLVEATNPNALAQPGGLAIKNTTVDQSGGGTIEASGSRVDLQSAIILGGTLATANGGVIDTIDFGSMLTGTSSQVNNTGTLVVNDDTALTLQGTINNTGEISENSVGSNTDLYIDSSNAMLTGGGAVSLSDNSHNFITASSVGATLTNVDNTISGSGQIIGDTVHGYVTLALVNEQQGVIDATGSGDLVLNVNSFTNDGLVEATNSGTLVIDNGVDNTNGKIAASGAGSTVTLSGGTVTNGTVTINAADTLSIEGTSVATLNGVSVTLANGAVAIGSLALDGNGFSNTAAPTTSTSSVTLTTANANDVIILDIVQNGTTVNTVSDTAGLVWHQRAVAGTAPFTIYEYYAIAPTALLADTITVNFAGTPGYVDLNTFGVSGASTLAPFDTNVSLPATPAVSTGSVTTSNANDFIFAGYRFGTDAAPTAGSGWTAINTNPDYNLAEYQIVSTTQAGLVATASSTDQTGGIVDAIVQATAPAVTGMLTVDAGSTLDLSGTTISGGTLINSGATTVTGGAATTLSGVSISNAGATVAVDAGSTLDLNGTTITNGALSNSGMVDSTGISALNVAVTNSGLLEATGGTLTIDPNNVTNTGTLGAKTGGTLKLESISVTNTDGTMKVDASSTLDLNNTTIAGGTLSYSGNVSVIGGATSALSGMSVNASGTGTIRSLALDGNGFSNTAAPTTSTSSVTLTTANANDVIILDIVQNGTTVNTVSDTAGLVWHQRAVAGTAPFTIYEYYAIAPTALLADTITVNFAGTPGYVDLNTFGVSGASTLAPFDTNVSLPATPAVSTGSVTTSNANDFIFAGYRFGTDAAPTAGSGWTAINTNPDYNLAEYQIVSTTQAGLVATASSTDQTGGIVDAIVQATAPAVTGMLTVDAGSTLDLSGTTISGGTLINSGAIVGNGNSAIDNAAIVNSGEIETGGPFTLDGDIVNGGVLTGTGAANSTFNVDSGNTLTLNSVTVVAGNSIIAALNNAGKIILQNALTLGTSPSFSTSAFTLALDGAGTASLNGATIVAAAAMETFENNGNTLSGAGQIGDGTTSNLTFNNNTSGVLAANVVGHALVVHTGNAITNNGTLEANAGTLDIVDAVSGTGSALITGGGTLEIGGSDAQAVTFTGAGGALKLDNPTPTSFTGQINGLALGDTIDLTNIKVASAVISGSTLTVTESNNQTLTYHVAGSLTGNSFAIQNDNAGGDELVLADASSYFWGNVNSPSQQGVHLFPGKLEVDAFTGAGALFYSSTGPTPSYDPVNDPTGPYSITRDILPLDPFFLPTLAGSQVVMPATLLTLPARGNFILPSINTVNGVESEGIAVFETQDGAGNNVLDQAVGSGGSGDYSPITIGSPIQIENAGANTIYNLSASFRQDNGTAPASYLSSYSVAWDQYNASTQTLGLRFQIFNADGSQSSSVTTPVIATSSGTSVIASATPSTNGATTLPAWEFRNAGGIYVLGVAEHNSGTNEDFIQFQGYNTDGTANTSNPAHTESFTVQPVLTAYAAGATNHITQDVMPSLGSFPGNPGQQLSFAQDSVTNDYFIGWNETVTNSSGTSFLGDQVEFAVRRNGFGVLTAYTDHTLTDAQNIRVANFTINGNVFAVLVYGDATTTHLVEFQASISGLAVTQIASITDPTTQAFTNIVSLGDGRIEVNYDNVLDSSQTSQFDMKIFDFRTAGLNIDDSGLGDGQDQYIAGTHYSDTFTGESNVNNFYYYVGLNGTANLPSDTFHGGTSGWNVAVFPDSRANYTIQQQVGDFLIKNVGDSAHAGSLTVDNNVQALAFDPAHDPLPHNDGSLEATGDTLMILTNFTNAATIDAGATLEFMSADSGPVTFAGITGALRLDNPTLFTGQITGIFGSGDVLDLTGFDNTAAVSYSGNTSGGTLTVSEGSTIVNLTVAGTNIGIFAKAGLDNLGTGLLIHDPPADSNSDGAATPATITDAADGVLNGANSGDLITVMPTQNDYIGSLSTSVGNDGSIDWHFNATTNELAQLADQTQAYSVQNQTNPAANQSLSVSVGANDQFQFQINAGSGAHAMANFSILADQSGNYIGETIDLSGFTNSHGAILQLADVLADLTTDNHGNAVVNLGAGDTITFQNIAQGIVSAEASHIFITHANVV